MKQAILTHPFFIGATAIEQLDQELQAMRVELEGWAERRGEMGPVMRSLEARFERLAQTMRTAAEQIEAHPATRGASAQA